ncbi:MAG TPA: hypothetical protein VNN12_04055 [Dehalococcoidia bacterium]|jgi:hypothetical protein|nr:hypothetical protein [Dehalococcoidia bacterium]
MLDYNVALTEYVADAILQERIREAEARRRVLRDRKQRRRERRLRHRGVDGATLQLDQLMAARRI